VLSVDGLHLRRGGFALGPLSLEVERGSYLALVGPSGSGKTLLLEWMAGFERADAGSLKIDGKDVTAMPPQQRPVSVVYQDSALFPHLSVRDNIGFALRVTGKGRDFADKRIGEVAETLSIARHLDADVAALSGGERRRVALARALVLPRPVLLLDEPLSALDAHLRWQLSTELDRVRQQFDLTVVHVTHDLSLVSSIASHLAVLGGGKLIQSGWCDDVLDHPSSAEVAAALDVANFVEAAGDADAGCMRLPGGGELPAPKVPGKHVRARITGLKVADGEGGGRLAGTCIGIRRRTGEPALLRVVLDVPDDVVVFELPAAGETRVGERLFIDFGDASYDYY